MDILAIVATNAARAKQLVASALKAATLNLAPETGEHDVEEDSVAITWGITRTPSVFFYDEQTFTETKLQDASVAQKGYQLQAKTIVWADDLDGAAPDTRGQLVVDGRTWDLGKVTGVPGGSIFLLELYR